VFQSRAVIVDGIAQDEFEVFVKHVGMTESLLIARLASDIQKLLAENSCLPSQRMFDIVHCKFYIFPCPYAHLSLATKARCKCHRHYIRAGWHIRCAELSGEGRPRHTSQSLR